MKKTEAVIFDWAGTTVDYGSFAPVQAFIEAFQEFGIEPTAAEVRKPMGMLKIDHIRTMMQMDRIRNAWKEKWGRDYSEEDVVKVYQKSEAKIMDILPDFTDVKPAVLETVEWLKSRGIKIGSTTGYTDAMMEIVVPNAKKAGYEPDMWISPNGVQNMGRPYPYMIFRNMEALKVSSVHTVIKVGDTIADIKEGINAGVCTVGIVEGSSLLGLSKSEYDALSQEEQLRIKQKTAAAYKEAGADYIIQDMSALRDVICGNSEAG